MRLIIAGSRTVSPTIADIDRAAEDIAIDVYGLRPGDCAEHGWKQYVNEVISGDANGSDKAGEEWAKARGVPVFLDPVTDEDYATHGRYLAPKMRNRRMAERGTHALIFWDGTSGGSADMCTRMVARGKPVVIVPMKPARPRRGRS